jgi:hypothetical protein
MRNRVTIFRATFIAACLLSEIRLAGQAPESGPPQATTAPKVENKTTKTVPDVPDSDANGFSIGASYWLTGGSASLLAGTQSVDPAIQNLVLPTPDSRSPGVRITTPAGKYNRIEISGFQTNTNGSSTAKQDLFLLGNPFTLGDKLQINYKIRNVKATWNYLMYPAPPTSKIRFKALFGFEYIGVKTTISAPLDTNATTSSGSRNVFLPTLGVGMDIVANKHVRLEVNPSAMAFPHRSYVVDGDASIVVSYSHVELVGGGRYLHFRSSPKNDQYVRGTLTGPYVGVRFVLGR